MSGYEFLLLVLAGVAAGLTGAVTGLASVISYPALLATGLSPVIANVTNTVALVFSGLGSTLGSRPELRGQGQRMRVLGVAGTLGGALGAVLLLVTPADAFERVVPVLIGGASLCVLIPRPRAQQHHTGSDARWVVAGVFAVSVYGGYFGAAAGVLMLALLLFATAESLPNSNAIKNTVLALANGIAALGFIVFSDVVWLAVLPLAIGFFAGGWLGPLVVRRLPAQPLRLLIAAAGVAIAIRLGLQAY
ncbi:MAG TPA: sulfite exporter TauE/SafE family protein [Jatrophihabitans sp.]|uniref:sulfite exporter TauE/SafE family protein n=1 Tax=Jatrophihabitans sp. TaxID=1932789 RepID=UPI002F12AD35